MKIPYFCCIGAELKRYAKDFDFMNQVYLYKVPTDDTIDEVFAQDYFKAISDTVLQDDILYVYETEEQKLIICRFDKANGHITAVPLASNVPELEPDRILVSDQDGKIAAGDLSLEYIKDTLSILHCTATLSSTVDTTTVVMLDELEAFANLDSRPSYKAAGALVIDANGNHGIIESVDTANETAVIVTTFAYNAVVKDSAETQVMQGGLQTPELETTSLIVNGAATFEEAPITNDTTTYQSAASDSLVRKEQVEEVVQDIKTSSLTFIGYVSTTEPSSATYTFNKHDLWLNSATMPTSFPFAQANIKEWDGTAWVAHSQDYTAANFDFFRNINDSEGYYWFAGQWVVMSTDMSTTYFQLNTVSGKWEIKSDVNLPGAPTTTTPSAGDSSTRIATTKFVADSFAPLASPALTGTPTTPTPSTGDNSTKIATTAFTKNEITAAKEKVISNCITEIPQDINLSINSSYQLVLASGSSAYRGGGTKITAATNVTYSAATSQPSTQFIVMLNLAGDTLQISSLSSTVSAATNPGGTYRVWFNTTDGKCYWNDGSANPIEYSLPIAIVTHTNGTGWTKIDQVFNGFGYIGSTIFVLPGVKALIPNGRNSDGTLKNTLLTKQSVNVFTPSSATFSQATNIALGDTLSSHTFTYDEANNINSAPSFMNAGDVTWSNGKITYFAPKTVFHAAEYEGMDYVVAFQIPTAENNYTWYRKYKSRWVEQGGVVNTAVQSPNIINLPVTMADANYTPGGLPQSVGNNGQGYTSEGWAERTTTSFKVYGHTAGAAITNAYSWWVFGMAA